MASEKSACDDLHAFLPADATSLDSKLRAPNSKQAFQHIEALCLGVAVVAAEHPDQFAKNLMDDHQIDLANGPFQGFLGQPRLSRVIVGHQSDHHIRVDCDHGFLRRLVPASPAAAAAWATASFTSSVSAPARAGAEFHAVRQTTALAAVRRAQTRRAAVGTLCGRLARRPTAGASPLAT